MGTIFKKTFTKPLPPGAELIDRKGGQFARWKDRTGKMRTEKVIIGNEGSLRLQIEADTYTAKYRDGSDIVREVATGCHDETAARHVLAELVKRAEHVKSGIVTAAQDRVIDQQAVAMEDHVVAYLANLIARGVSRKHYITVSHNLNRVVKECEFERLANLDRTTLETWLSNQANDGMSARTRNTYLAALSAFANWCIETNRLTSNPFRRIAKANEKADQRRRRRALTDEELLKLLDVAKHRPLEEAKTIRRGKNKGKAIAELRPETVARLEMLGRERALIYKTLVLTGLRKGELASLTVGQLVLDDPSPYALLHAADEKNRRGSRISLRADLVADLQAWISDRLADAQNAAQTRNEPIPARLPDETPLFNVPEGLVKILDRDMLRAGIVRKVKDPKTGRERIDKRDGRGWTFDVHALRTTFGTLLSKGGVSLRTTQAAMRHSDPTLTANVYTDPQLLDVAGALNTLPSLPLEEKPQAERQQKTGTYGVSSLAPVNGKMGPNGSTAVKTADAGTWAADKKKSVETPCNINEKRPVSYSGNGRHSKRTKGLESSTFTLVTCSDSNPSVVDTGLTEGDNSACTTDCTREPGNVNGVHSDASDTQQNAPTPFETLALAITNLSDSDRVKLAALLAKGKTGSHKETL